MTIPAAVLVGVAAFVLMEPVTALTHRFVMHGIGGRLHRSHHQPDGSRFELNDWVPVMFAALVMLGIWAGFNLDGLRMLLPVGIGVTLYGLAYALVQDVAVRPGQEDIAHDEIGAVRRVEQGDLGLRSAGGRAHLVWPQAAAQRSRLDGVVVDDENAPVFALAG